MLPSVNAQRTTRIPGFASLRARLLILLLLTFLPVYSFILYAVLDARQQAASHAQGNALTITRLVALKQKSLVENSQQQLLNFTQLPIVRRPELAGLCSQTFANLLKLSPQYNNFGVINLDGTLRCSALKPAQPINLSDRSYFRDAISTRTFTISEYQIGRLNGRGVNTLAYPVLDADGKPLSVVFIALDLAALNNILIKSIALPQGLTLSIRDAGGTVLARYPDPELWIGKTYPNSPQAMRLLAQGQEGATEETGLDGIKRLYAFKPFHITANKQVYVSAGIPTDIVYADANAMLSRALLLMTLVTISAIVLALGGSRILVLRPMNSLMDAARRFGSGKLNVRTGLAHTKDEFGQMARVFDEMAQSIEEREKQQRASEVRFMNIVNLAGDAIISVDDEQRIIAYNNTAMQIFGYTPEQAIGQPIDLLLPPDIVTEHRKHIQNFGREAGVTRVMGGGREIAGRHADGTIFPAEASISKFIEGKKTMYTVVLRDISERKHAEMALKQKEALLSMVGKMAQVGGWEFDARTLKASWTEEVARIHDTDPEDPTGVESGIQYYCEGSRQIIESAVKDAIELGKSYDLELEITTAKGKHKWVRTIGQAVMENGVVTKVWGSFQDITRHRQDAEEIRQLNLNLEQRIAERTLELASANKELEAFSYSVSHDLRAPLRAIDGFSLALHEDYAAQLDDQARDYINRVRNATQRMGILIDDLLKLSRMSRAEILRQPVDLSAMAVNVAAELQKTEPERKVSWHIAPDLVAQADPHLLRVVLDNLLGNAWKFTGKTINARIEFIAEQNADGNTEFTVRDNGAGFDMNYAGKLFTPFQRMHLASDFPGTGVGLATVQRIVRRHGGYISGTGTPGLGAVFKFTLPT